MRITLAILAAVGILTLSSFAQVVQLYGTNELAPSRTTISFDDYPHMTVANTLYQGLGLTFSRDDGGFIPILDVTQFGVHTVSSNNALATPSFPVIGPTQAWSTHLVLDSLRPLTEVGAFFGNDNNISDFGFQRLSVYGISNVFLGSIDVAVNNNTDIDQFIGIRSAVPFYRVRFENFTSLGTVSAGRAVGIDDLTFTAASIRPKLNIARLALGQVRLAWPAEATGFTVQTLTNIASTNWQDLLTTPLITGSENVVTNAPGVSPMFFRLRK